MLKENHQIDNLSFFFLLVAIMIEFGVLIAPQTIAEEAGSGAWLSLVISYIPSLLACFFVVRLAQLFPGESFFTYSPKIVGKWLGTLLTLVYIVYWLIIGARVVRVFAGLLKSTLLFRTPIELIILLFLLLAAHLARGGVEPIARFSVMAVLISIPLSFILVLLTYSDWDLSNLMPVFENGLIPVTVAGFKFLGQIEGLESILFLMAFVRQPKKSMPYAIAAIFLTVTVVLMVTMASLLDLGIAESKRLIFPAINLIQSVEIPGRFLERLGSIYSAVWIFILFPTTVAFLYLPSLALMNVFRLSDFRSFVPLLIPVVYLISLIPASTAEVFSLIRFMNPINIFLIGVLPLLLFIIARLRGFGKGRRK